MQDSARLCFPFGVNGWMGDIRPGRQALARCPSSPPWQDGNGSRCGVHGKGLEGWALWLFADRRSGMYCLRVFRTLLGCWGGYPGVCGYIG